MFSDQKSDLDKIQLITLDPNALPADQFSSRAKCMGKLLRLTETYEALHTNPKLLQSTGGTHTKNLSFDCVCDELLTEADKIPSVPSDISFREPFLTYLKADVKSRIAKWLYQHYGLWNNDGTDSETVISKGESLFASVKWLTNGIPIQIRKYGSGEGHLCTCSKEY